MALSVEMVQSLLQSVESIGKKIESLKDYVGGQGQKGGAKRSVKVIESIRAALNKLEARMGGEGGCAVGGAKRERKAKAGRRAQRGGNADMMNSDVMNTSDLLQTRDVFNMGADQATAMKYTNTVPFTAGGSETEPIMPSGSNDLLPPTYSTAPTVGGARKAKKGIKAKRT